MTVPSPVVAKRWRSGDSLVDMWWENVVALVWIGWGWESRVLYMVDLEVLSLTEIFGDEGDSRDIGTRVSSYHYEVCVRYNGRRLRESDILPFFQR